MVRRCHTPRWRLNIAHVTRDWYVGRARRHGGKQYSRWMAWIRQHPEDYTVLCAYHHELIDRGEPMMERQKIEEFGNNGEPAVDEGWEIDKAEYRFGPPR